MGSILKDPVCKLTCVAVISILIIIDLEKVVSYPLKGSSPLLRETGPGKLLTGLLRYFCLQPEPPHQIAVEKMSCLQASLKVAVPPLWCPFIAVSIWWPSLDITSNLCHLDESDTQIHPYQTVTFPFLLIPKVSQLYHIIKCSAILKVLP